MSKLLKWATGLAIFISCLGMLGLVIYTTNQRVKEIGVRKVLGASVFNLWQMLSKEFALLVSISCLIAIPLAWYYLNNWLQQYDYRTNISLWVFLISGIGALLITLLTVSFQAIKAAIANPVKSLRTEWTKFDTPYIVCKGLFVLDRFQSYWIPFFLNGSRCSL